VFEGMLLRGCAPKPADTPDGIGIVAGSNARIFGPFRWDDGLDNGIQDGVDYYCKTAPSRDSYAGTLYGLPYADDLVGKDDPALREQIRGDVLVLAGRLVKYGLSFPRPHGNVSRGPRPRRPPSQVETFDSARVLRMQAAATRHSTALPIRPALTLLSR
jgi:hypothetical protein